MTNPPDVIERRSGRSLGETLALLRAAIDGAGLTVFATIDHAAAARKAGLAMPPTVVLVYGHARGGTPIMQAAPNAALDLPLRVLVREAADGVRVVYHPAAAMLEQAGVPEELAGRLDGLQRLIDLALEGG